MSCRLDQFPTKVQMATILVIENEEIILDNLLEILQLEGFQAIGANGGVMGVEQAKTYLPDLILCDIGMPELDGYGVLNVLRRDPQTAAIPIIFLTAKGERAEIRQGMNLGADDYLIKPCAIEDLLEAISSRLRKYVGLTQIFAKRQPPLPSLLPGSAYLDPLTHLPNRTLFYQQLQQILARQSLVSIGQINRGDAAIAVFCLNVNRFRTVNTSFGYHIGDRLLQELSKRLVKAIGSQATVARLGADEFGIIVTGHPQEQDLVGIAQAILVEVTAPYLLTAHKIQIQVSIGIALQHQHGSSPERLLVQAETARRWCQKQGQSGYMVYSLTMDALEVERRLIEADLSNAIAEQTASGLKPSEFQLYYQPQVHLATGRIIGVEALLRWHHPQRGMIPPKIFIPIAEEMGLIVTLGEWVLRAACAQVQSWQTLSLMPLKVAVNLSMRQFQQEKLAQRVGQILAETGLNPKLLVLELTESILMEDVGATVAVLRELKQLGVEISLDDFGTGYSSLNYLSDLPIDALKIDQTFVRQGAINSGAAAISTAIIMMAQSLQLNVIAEGVETQKQVTFLQEIGCQIMQGFLYSPPIPADEMQPLLTGDRCLQLASA